MGEMLFKVVFELPRESQTWPPFAVERLWTANTPTRMQVRLRDVPFFATGVAYDDLVRVRVDHCQNGLVYQELIEESGHSTVRILLHSLEAREHIGQLLLASGCRTKVGLIEDHLAVDVPVEADYPALRLGLIALREAGLIGLHESAISLVHQGQLVGSAR